MGQTQINIIKFIISFIFLIIVYATIIEIVKPVFPNVSVLVYIAIGVILALAFFILMPYWIFQFRGKE